MKVSHLLLKNQNYFYKVNSNLFNKCLSTYPVSGMISNQGFSSEKDKIPTFVACIVVTHS